MFNLPQIQRPPRSRPNAPNIPLTASLAMEAAEPKWIHQKVYSSTHVNEIKFTVPREGSAKRGERREFVAMLSSPTTSPLPAPSKAPTRLTRGRVNPVSMTSIDSNARGSSKMCQCKSESYRIRSSAFTLLEMLLTLAMSVVLMGLISGAITFYARDMNNAEQEFRRTQLAASILQMIEDDLRQTLVTAPADTAPLADVLASATAPLEALGSADTGDASGLSTLDAGAVDMSMELESLDVVAGGTVLQSPGLIGDSMQLQIDVSRLPSLESYFVDPDLMPVDSNVELTDRPSDIKTVAYFVASEANLGPVDAMSRLASSIDSSMDTSAGASGLVRREIDRAISTQASSTGGLSRLLATGQVVAPEVTSIAFEYFDGITWLPQYSSDELGYLPQAVRVTLTLSEPLQDPADSSSQPTTFTHLIYLPFSHPEDGEELLEELTTDDAMVAS